MSARPLIPRRKLFGNPTYVGAKLSPDGQLLSWLAPVDGVLNIWVSPVDSIRAGQPVTRTRGRPINWQSWSPDGRYIMLTRMLVPKPKNAFQSPDVHSAGLNPDVFRSDLPAVPVIVLMVMPLS